jgi:hypothetical protein
VCIDLAVEVARCGAMPVVPNALTDPRFMQAQGYDFWLKATGDLLRRCDAVDEGT